MGADGLSTGTVAKLRVPGSIFLLIASASLCVPVLTVEGGVVQQRESPQRRLR